MVPPASHRVSRVRWYSGYSLTLQIFGYRALTLCGRPSQTVLLIIHAKWLSATPKILLPSVWPNPRSLATTSGISVDVSSSPYLDVSVQAVPHVSLFDSVYVTSKLVGFPIRKSPDRSLCAAPRSLSQLIASFIGS